MRIAARLRGKGESATLAVTKAAAALKAKGEKVIDLGIGEPDFPTPKPVIDGAIAALEAGFTKYTAAIGINELRDAIAAHHKAGVDRPFTRDWVAVTAGAKQALFNVFMSILDPGDEVVVPTPCWVSFPDQIRLALGVTRFVPAPLEAGFVPDAAEIERAVGPKTRAILLNSPCNPTGAVVPRQVLAAIVDVVRSRDLYLVSDETYDRFVFTDEPYASAADFCRELGERLVLVNSFSKTYCMTGLRLGYVIAAPELINAVGSLQSHTTSNPSSIAQKAGLIALTGSQAAVDEMLAEYSRRRTLVLEMLQGMPGVELHPPAGAFYAFPRVEGAMAKRGIKDDGEFAKFLLEEAKVAVVPGSAFEAEGFVRLSFAARIDLLKEALGRLRQVLGAA